MMQRTAVLMHIWHRAMSSSDLSTTLGLQLVVYRFSSKVSKESKSLDCCCLTLPLLMLQVLLSLANIFLAVFISAFTRALNSVMCSLVRAGAFLARAWFVCGRIFGFARVTGADLFRVRGNSAGMPCPRILDPSSLFVPATRSGLFCCVDLSRGTTHNNSSKTTHLKQQQQTRTHTHTHTHTRKQEHMPPP